MSTSPPDLSDFTPDLSDFTPDASAPAPASPGFAHQTNYSGTPLPSEPASRYEAIGKGIKDMLTPPTTGAISGGMQNAKDVLDALVTGNIPGRLGQKIGEQPGAPTYTLRGGHIGDFLSSLKQSIVPQGQFPVSQAIGRVGAMAGMAALGGGEKVPKPAAVASPEMALTSALRPSAKVNVMTVAPDALPALRESAGYLNATPESLQGVHGVVRGQQLVSHALDVLESKFQQLIGPVKQEAVTPAMLEKYPDLADYLGAKDKPTTINDINGARIAKGNQFYSKGAMTQQGATGNLLDAKRINGQAADFLYDYIKQRTGVDPSSIKAQQSALLKLKPVMDRTVADTLKQEADFRLNPPAAKTGVFRNTLTAIRAASGNPDAIASILEKARGNAPAISPAELFNSKMRLVLQGVKPGGPPAMGAPDLIGGPQEFAPAPTQFGSRTGQMPQPVVGGMARSVTQTPVPDMPPATPADVARLTNKAAAMDPNLAALDAQLKQRAAEFARQGEQVGGFPLKSQTPTTTSSEDIPPSQSYYDKYGNPK